MWQWPLLSSPSRGGGPRLQGPEPSRQEVALRQPRQGQLLREQGQEEAVPRPPLRCAAGGWTLAWALDPRGEGRWQRGTVRPSRAVVNGWGAGCKEGGESQGPTPHSPFHGSFLI